MRIAEFKQRNLSDGFITNIIIILVILSISLLIFKKYIFQGYLFIPQGPMSDLLRINLPVYTLLYDCISKGGLFWSWSDGIGTNIFVHADVFFDPFTYLTLLNGRDGIAGMMIWAFIAKIICEGVTFSYYARYFHVEKAAIIVGAVIYAFCGYSLIMGSNLALGTILFYFPLLLLAIEIKLKENRNIFLLVILFLICIYSYYYFYISSIITLGYLFFRCEQEHKPMIHNIAHFILIGFLAMLLASFTVLPQVYLAFSSTRMNAGKDVTIGLKLLVPDIRTFITEVARSFGLNTLGNDITNKYIGYTFNRQPDYFQSELYVSVLAFPLFFQYIFFSKKSRTYIIKYSLTLLLMAIIPFVSFLLNAFATINYRWIFIIHFMISFMCVLSLDKILKEKMINIPTLMFSQILGFIILVSSVIFTGIVRHLGRTGTYEIFVNNQRYFITIIILYSLIVLLAKIYNSCNENYIGRIIVSILLLALIGTDYSVNYDKWYRSDASVGHFSYGSHYGYDDSSNKVIKDILATNKGFYRIYKDFDSVYDNNGIPSDNDALVQKYLGLKSYCSLNNANYINFLQHMGVYVACVTEIDNFKKNNIKPEMVNGPNLNYINGIDDRYELLDYLGVKYYIHKHNSKINVPENFRYIDSVSDMDVYINTNNYPLAFITNKYMYYDDFKKLQYAERANVLLTHTILMQKDTDIDIIDFQKSNNYCKLLNFSNDKLFFAVNGMSDWQYISFLIPYDKGWSIYVDDKKVISHKINIGLLGAKIPKGEHKVRLEYYPNGLYLGMEISVFTLIFLLILRKKY